jgi:DNA ligase (NAD+)
MSKKSVQIKSLEKQIKKARNAYYNKKDGEDIMSDAAFDALVDTLAKLDPENELVTGIGAPVVEDGWKKAKHQIVMGSLNKAAEAEEINAWLDKYITETDQVFIIDKVDGLSIECLYEDGKLISAISRGDGKIGDEIFDNVSKMGGVKLVLPLLFTGSLRGEIILTKDNHKKHFADKANVRNTAAGVSRRLDGEGCEHLNVIFYQAIGNVDLATEVEQMEYLKKNLGLTVPEWCCSSEQDEKERMGTKEFVQWVYDSYQGGLRANLDYEIDGLVVKVNSLQEQQEHGDRDGRPRAAIAYKFPVEKAETPITNIVIQTGHSGRITPVAEFDQVLLAGAMIGRATLHNFKRVQELGVDVGAVVLITRRGDVIPAVEVVLNHTDTVYPTPTECPTCGGPVEMQGENLMCISTDTCPAQVKGRISNWVNTIGVLEWGDKIIDKLVESGLVESIQDLYKLTVEDLMTIERMGEKSAKKCHVILWSHKEIPLEIFIGGLSIPMASTSTIKLLMEAGYDTIDKIRALRCADGIELMKVRGIGAVKAKSIIDGLIRNNKAICEILGRGIKIKAAAAGNLTGKKIAITGSTNLKRSILQGMIAENGGTYKSSISKDCTYLVISDPESTSIKAVSARGMGIKLIGEDELLEMIK